MCNAEASAANSVITDDVQLSSGRCCDGDVAAWVTGASTQCNGVHPAALVVAMVAVGSASRRVVSSGSGALREDAATCRGSLWSRVEARGPAVVRSSKSSIIGIGISRWIAMWRGSIPAPVNMDKAFGKRSTSALTVARAVPDMLTAVAAVVKVLVEHAHAAHTVSLRPVNAAVWLHSCTFSHLCVVAKVSLLRVP